MYLNQINKIPNQITTKQNGPNKKPLTFVLFNDIVDMVFKENPINCNLSTISKSQIPKFILPMGYHTRILKWKALLRKLHKAIKILCDVKSFVSL